MWNRFWWLLSVLCFLAPVLTAQSCSLASLSGGYSYGVNGTVFSGSGALIGFYSTIGVLTADGKGAIRGTSSGTSNGVAALNVPWTGSYTVNSDCSGTAIINLAGQVRTFVIALSANGDQAAFLETTPGVTGAGSGTRQMLLNTPSRFGRQL